PPASVPPATGSPSPSRPITRLPAGSGTGPNRTGPSSGSCDDRTRPAYGLCPRSLAYDSVLASSGPVARHLDTVEVRHSAVNVLPRHVRCPTLQQRPNRLSKSYRSRSIRVGGYGPLLH